MNEEINHYGLYTKSLEKKINKEIKKYQEKLKLCNLIGQDKCEKIIEIIKHFIKSKKRIIYGGMAINASLPENEKIYSGENYDFDIYSSCPKRDLIEIINELNKLDLPYLSGMESGHPGVYKLFIYFMPILDITYLPKYIIDEIPTFESHGFIYPQPSFLKNDILLSLTNNIYSSYRWEKDYGRYKLLNTNYPFERPTGFSCERNSSTINQKIKFILEFIKNKVQDETIITLSYAYLLYKKENELIDLFKLASSFVTVYHPEPEKLINIFQNSVSKNAILKIKKYEPFLRYLPMSYEIYWDDVETPVFKIYNSQGLCIPYHTLQEVKIVSLGKLLLDVKINEFLNQIKKKDTKFYACMAYEIDRMNRTTDDLTSIFSLMNNKCLGIQAEEGFLIQNKKNKFIPKFDYSPTKNKFTPINPKTSNSGSIKGIEAKELE